MAAGPIQSGRPRDCKDATLQPYIAQAYWDMLQMRKIVARSPLGVLC
jgi:hypothetical protein